MVKTRGRAVAAAAATSVRSGANSQAPVFVCPACGRRYPAGLLYCTEDGARLVREDRGDAEPTSEAGVPDEGAGPLAPSPRRDSDALRWVVLALAVALALAVGLLIGRGSPASDTAPQIAETRPASGPAGPAVADGERAEVGAWDPGGPGATRYVNTPGDGFLALRSAPSVRGGERRAEVPHGAAVEVGSCGRSETIGGRYGTWCRARYGGAEGWAFDGFLVAAASAVEAREAPRRPASGRVRVGRRAEVWGPEGYLNLRASPSLDAWVLARMPNGVAVTVAECERRVWGADVPRRWCRVRYRGADGWASDRFLDGVSP